MTTHPTWHDILLPGEATDFFERTRMEPFDLSADGYSPVNARWLMELSRLVYRHDVEEAPKPQQPTRTEFLSKAGFRQVDFFQYKKGEIDTQAMLVASTQSNFAVLAFRGTEPIGDELITPDLWTDLKAWKRSVNSVKKAGPLAESRFTRVSRTRWTRYGGTLRRSSPRWTAPSIHRAQPGGSTGHPSGRTTTAGRMRPEGRLHLRLSTRRQPGLCRLSDRRTHLPRGTWSRYGRQNASRETRLCTCWPETCPPQHLLELVPHMAVQMPG